MPFFKIKKFHWKMNLTMDYSTILTVSLANQNNVTTKHGLEYGINNIDDNKHGLEYSDIEENYSMTEHLCNFLINAIMCKFLNGLSCVLGLLGNSLTIMVLVRLGLKDTTNLLLSSIATCDIIYLLSDVTQVVHRILLRIDPVMGRNFERVFYNSLARVCNISLFCSIFQVAVMASERLTAVLFPFIVTRIFTPFRIKCCIGLSLVYSCAFSLPSYFIVDENTLSNEAKLEWSGKEFLFIVPPTFLYMMPMVVILICNITIGIKLHLLNGTFLSEDSTSRSLKRQKELKLFKRLVVVCFVASITFLPRIVLAWILFFNSELAIVRNGNIRLIFSTCFHIYASSNFIIYVSMSFKFAKAFKKLVCGRIEL